MTASLAMSALLPRFLEQGRAETVRLALTLTDGAIASVTSATYSLIDNDQAAVIDAAAATISNGAASYAIASNFAAAYTLPVEVWRERWVTAGVSGDVAAPIFERDVYLCRRAPVSHVTLEHLYQLHPQWRRQVPRSQPHGSAQTHIETAWDEMLARMLGDGLLPHRVLNWWALAEVHKYWAATLVCRDFSTDDATQSRWERLGATYWDRSQSEYERLKRLALDDDEDGIADRTSVKPAPGAPPRQWRWS